MINKVKVSMDSVCNACIYFDDYQYVGDDGLILLLNGKIVFKGYITGRTFMKIGYNVKENIYAIVNNNIK